MLKLVIQDDEGKTTVVPLIRDEITIGRKEGNTIRLTERNVSRRHARILRSNGSVAIEDLNSYNGIRINGSRIQGRSGLTVSDRVQIGDYLIEVKSEGDKVESYDDNQETKPVERVSQQITADGATAVVAVPAHMAETVPVQQAPTQDVAVHAPAAAAHPNTPPRLVVLSTNFAGQEFDLDKPALVIGRTPDNDIVVDHRSISRHHAKVVQENGRYAIVDLQSSNGVRVNGEDYGKVELRRGDLVDLGHVRMRFVEAGEDFVFGRDAHPVDIGGGGRSMGMILAALLVIGGGIGIFVMTRGGDDKPKAVVPAAGTGSSDVAIVAPTVTPDAAAEVTPPVDDGSEEIKALLADAAAAIDADKWADAQAAAQQVLDLDPANAAAKNIEEQARREIANALRHKDFEKAVKARNYAQVATLFEGIDHDSVYKDRARDDHDRLRDDYIQAAEGKAAKLADAGKCKEIKKVAAQYTAWPEAAKIVSDIDAGCKETVAIKPPVDDKKPPVDDKKPPVDDKKPPASGKTAEQLVEEAKAAAKGAQFGRALRLCEEALTINKGDQEATMVCAIAACNLKNEAKAKKHIGKLTNAQRKGMSRQICLRNGVNID